MSTAIVIPEGFGIVRWLFQCVGRPNPQYVTCGVQGASTPTATQIADDAHAAWTSAFGGASLSPSYTYLGTTCTYRLPAGLSTGAHAASVVGSSAATNPLSANTAILVRKVTGLSDRWNRGRMYWPGGFSDESQVDAAGFLNAGSITTLTGKFNALFTAMNPSTHIQLPVILHHDPAKSPTPITAFTLQPQCATQRHRMRK